MAAEINCGLCADSRSVQMKGRKWGGQNAVLLFLFSDRTERDVSWSCGIEEPVCLRLQFKVKVLWVKVMNPCVSVFSSTAVTVNDNHSARNMLAVIHTKTLHISALHVSKRVRLLPLAIGVECHTVDGTEVTFDPSKLLFISSVEEPECWEESQVTTCMYTTCIQASLSCTEEVGLQY